MQLIWLIRRVLDQLPPKVEPQLHKRRVWAARAGITPRAHNEAVLAAQHNVSARTIRQWVSDADVHLAVPLQTAIRDERWLPLEHDPVYTAVTIGRLHVAIARQDGSIEQFEALATLANLQLGSGRPVPRRSGARRDLRARSLRQLSGEFELMQALPLRAAAIDYMPQQLVNVNYPLAEDPSEAVRLLEQCWKERDRLVLPILANHAMAQLHTSDDALATDLQLQVLEILTNALRDAENAQAFVVAAEWRRRARSAGGPLDYRAWKANGVIIHLMEISGHTLAARRAQREHSEQFQQVRFPDSHDRDINLIDRIGRLVALHIESGKFREAAIDLRRLQTIQDHLLAPPDADLEFSVVRRGLELGLASATATSRGRIPSGGTPGVDRNAERIAELLPFLAPHRRASAFDLLLQLDIARHDWESVRARTHRLYGADNILEGSPPNLVERVDNRLARLVQRRSDIDYTPLLRVVDPLREPNYLLFRAVAR
ncbi:hypothetical protein [Rhodococcoides yunnanense]|uniref:Uncharacterized protein n=1 Tax=Rhodococcoides yunnanense TaxID=278209 RepID=A0ABU4BIN9_9NOCA|nr:hypothetical protein [Rhodococcus yunnanensis]MDV6263951.1 hypothetical protein [Rhodococcus yunnanensis]